jgi:hypothetical protein
MELGVIGVPQPQSACPSLYATFVGAFGCPKLVPGHSVRRCIWSRKNLSAVAHDTLESLIQMSQFVRMLWILRPYLVPNVIPTTKMSPVLPFIDEFGAWSPHCTILDSCISLLIWKPHSLLYLGALRMKTKQNPAISDFTSTLYSNLYYKSALIRTQRPLARYPVIDQEHR